VTIERHRARERERERERIEKKRFRDKCCFYVSESNRHIEAEASSWEHTYHSMEHGLNNKENKERERGMQE